MRISTALAPEAPAGELETGSESISCVIADESPERVALRFEAPRPGMVVLADAFDVGWTADLDDVRTPVLKANGIFRGVPVPAGAHTLVFEYHPRSFWLGLGISLTCLGVLMLGGLVGLLRRG